MATRAVPAPLAQLPNALTIARLALIPVFVALVIQAEGEASWAAGAVFGAAGITDQVDGWLARRWHVESEFGRFADPLADRARLGEGDPPGPDGPPGDVDAEPARAHRWVLFGQASRLLGGHRVDRHPAHRLVRLVEQRSVGGDDAPASELGEVGEVGMVQRGRLVLGEIRWVGSAPQVDDGPDVEGLGNSRGPAHDASPAGGGSTTTRVPEYMPMTHVNGTSPAASAGSSTVFGPSARVTETSRSGTRR